MRFVGFIMMSVAQPDTREWLETNGIGGYASSTVSGMNTRRYHGLLVAATKPPVGRMVLLSKLEETLVLDGRHFELSCNHYPGVIHPQGYRYLTEFRRDPFPVFVYEVEGVTLEKRVFMEPEANTTYVRYRLLRAQAPVTLELRALVNYRDYHGTTRGAGWQMRVAAVEAGVRVVAFDGATPFVILAQRDGEPAAPSASGSPPPSALEVRPAHTWYYGYQLAREEERGLDAQDDHLHAATIRVTLDVYSHVLPTMQQQAAEQLERLFGTG